MVRYLKNYLPSLNKQFLDIQIGTSHLILKTKVILISR